MNPARQIALIAVAVFSGGLPPAQAQAPTDGFLCCNMRTDGAWVSDSNYQEAGKRIIPFGTPVKYKGLGRYRVYIEVEGKSQAIGNDYSRDIPMEAFARRYIVSGDPRPKVSRAAPKIRGAIETARVTTGMTKEQVLTALGYPISSENPNLDVPRWRYWLWSFSPFVVHFGDAGRVSHVETDRDTLDKVFLK
jgi:hypothetical protein